jgi:hypothetical protein
MPQKLYALVRHPNPASDDFKGVISDITDVNAPIYIENLAPQTTMTAPGNWDWICVADLYTEQLHTYQISLQIMNNIEIDKWCMRPATDPAPDSEYPACP